MKDILPDNPASRLLSILKKANNYESNLNDLSSNIWASILNTEVSPSKLLPAYAQLFVLTDEAYEAVINFYPQQKPTHHKWYKGVTGLLQSCSPYHHKWADVKPLLAKPEIIDLLQVAADNLSHHVIPTYVDNFSLEKLKEEFTLLKEKIIKEDSFSEQLRYFLINELEKILCSLEDFELYGSSPIKESLYNIVSNSELENNNNYNFRDSLCKFLLIAAAAISMVNDIAALPDSLEFFKDKISDISAQVAHSPLPENLILPPEITYFREEDPN